MTPQQAAEKKYPYGETTHDVFEAHIGKLQIDQRRADYISGLQDAPQLSRSVLEEVRERCASVMISDTLKEKYVKSTSTTSYL
jgi:hypothetical protein